MTSKRKTSGLVRRTLLASGALVALSTSALAGQCPTNKVVADH